MTKRRGIQRNTDVVVVGGGHAGCEAALAAARIGADTVLLTTNLDHIAQMSCNPAIGGIAKGHVVREIDALGGEMGLNADAAAIQSRILNKSKGPAVQAPRAQCDKVLYQRRMKYILEQRENLNIHQAQVAGIVAEHGQVTAVYTDLDEYWVATAFIFCTGTFLNGTLHYGTKSVDGGRAGDPPATGLTHAMATQLSVATGRLKTGTPPRVLANSIDFSQMRRQDPENENVRFSFRTASSRGLPSEVTGSKGLPQLPCFLSETTEDTAEIIRNHIEESPLYSGRIEGTGIRYCPSFEDKVFRFPHHPRHTIYMEPEGAFTDEYYVNGISTSFPPELQWRMLQTIPGLERAVISRYAYGIEYDFVYPHQLRGSLALNEWPNVFLAGQINGTSGYEEAAGQGILAGINATRLVQSNESPFRLGRDQAYIGVMVDDLITKEITEPYRLFTSRAEYRLTLRPDNAHRRLTPIGYEAGLVSRAEYARVTHLEQEIERVKGELQNIRHDEVSLWEWLRRPEISYSDLSEAPQTEPEVIQQLEIDARYDGYIQREANRASTTKNLEAWKIPRAFPYSEIEGLRNEARDKLQEIQPEDLAQASRIDGVTPAEIALLQVHLARGSNKSQA